MSTNWLKDYNPKTYFDENYFRKRGDRGWYDDWAFDIRNMWHKQWVDFLIENVPLKFNTRILDLGTARGNVVYWLNKSGFDAYGVEISEWCIKNSHSFKIIQADISKNIPFKNQTFDYIIAREVLEHIPEDYIDTTIKEIYRILKTGGIAVISNATNRAGKEDKKRNSEYYDPSHVLIKSPWWWIQKFKEYNLLISYEDYVRISSEDWALKNNWDILIFKKGEQYAR